MAIVANILAGLLLAVLIWRAVTARSSGEAGDRDPEGRDERGSRE